MSLLSAMFGMVFGTAAAGPQMSQHGSSSAMKLETEGVPVYRFDNGWEWRRIVNVTQLDSLARRFSSSGEASVAVDVFRPLLIPRKGQLVVTDKTVGFVLLHPDDPGGALGVIGLSQTQTRGAVGNWGPIGLTFYIRPSLWFLPRNPQTGKIDMKVGQQWFDFLRAATWTLLFGWLELSPDGTMKEPLKRARVPFVIEDLNVFRALSRDPRLEQALGDAEGEDTAWAWETGLAHSLRSYEDEVLASLNHGLGPEDRAPYYSPSALREDEPGKWRWWWKGERIDLVIDAVFDPEQRRVTWSTEVGSTRHTNQSLPDLLLEVLDIVDEAGFEARIEALLMPGQPLIDLEPYELLDTTPPPLMPLSEFRAWAGLSSHPG